MYSLVVLFAAVAVASAAPSGLGLVAPAVHTYAAAPAVHTYAAAPVAAAVAVESPTVVETRTSVGYAQAAALSKQVHYAPKPVVTGYSSSVIKPDLGALATPLHSVLQQRVLAPSRAVHTITPQVTQVQPELHVQKVAVDVPVQTPYVSEVEVRTPQVVAKTAPVIAAPAVATYAAAAPAVATYAAAAPAVATYAAAAPAVHTYAAAAPAVLLFLYYLSSPVVL
ncbi:pupal cuticle protein G1A-like [Thrips palmi]|uniref:Pupal cuticle protein G1A-like n=1 Tax=Thrips palmi TaxID=161013 RepID=A0A6P8ZY09_THRPL|nr:pupal cuticle protein G1A-like [Thrips palmi]